jgi:ABC-type phosphate transport system substrate-binding protein
MQLTLRHFAFAATAALLCWAAQVASASAETLVVQGSTTFNSNLMVPYRGDIESVAGHQLRVIPSKSNVGLMALLAGEADLAMISSPLESEIALLRQTEPELPLERLQSFLIHRTRVAFAVHPDNPVRSSRWAMMRRVLNGEIHNWKHLGGLDLPIVVVCVREGGGVLMSVEKNIMRGDRISPRNLVTVETGPELPFVVAKDVSALGLAQMAEVRRHKLPELVLPAMIEQPLSLVSLGPPTPAMYAVIDAARRVVAGQLD